MASLSVEKNISVDKLEVNLLKANKVLANKVLANKVLAESFNSGLNVNGAILGNKIIRVGFYLTKGANWEEIVNYWGGNGLVTNSSLQYPTQRETLYNSSVTDNFNIGSELTAGAWENKPFSGDPTAEFIVPYLSDTTKYSGYLNDNTNISLWKDRTDKAVFDHIGWCYETFKDTESLEEVTYFNSDPNIKRNVINNGESPSSRGYLNYSTFVTFYVNVPDDVFNSPAPEGSWLYQFNPNATWADHYSYGSSLSINLKMEDFLHFMNMVPCANRNTIGTFTAESVTNHSLALGL